MSNLDEKVMKQLGVSTKAIAIFVVIGVGMYAYKTFLESTRTRLEIRRLRRDLGDDIPNGTLDKLSRRVERI